MLVGGASGDAGGIVRLGAANLSFVIGSTMVMIIPQFSHR